MVKCTKTLIYLKGRNSGLAIVCGIMKPTALRQKFAGLIWTTILVVAVQLLPSFAYAHAGHAHHSSPGAAASSETPAPHDLGKTVERQPVATVQVSTGQKGQALGDSNGSCTGSCCGNGIGCCGGVLAGLLTTLPDIAFLPAKFSFVSDWQRGIGPDAIKRPPRSLV